MDINNYRLEFLKKAHNDLNWGTFKDRVTSGDYDTSQALSYPPDKKEWIYEVRKKRKLVFTGLYDEVLNKLCNNDDNMKTCVGLLSKEIRKTRKDVNHTFSFKEYKIRVANYAAGTYKPKERIVLYADEIDLKDMVEERDENIGLGVLDNGELVRRDKSKDKWTKIRIDYIEKERAKFKEKIKQINA